LRDRAPEGADKSLDIGTQPGAFPLVQASEQCVGLPLALGRRIPILTVIEEYRRGTSQRPELDFQSSGAIEQSVDSANN
jgi:hypothetical protein